VDDLKRRTLVSEILQTLHLSSVPVSTPDLIALHGEGMNNPRQNLWTTLNWMLKTGRVRKQSKVHDTDRGPRRSAYWSPA
jgi:hypothetical protein